MRSSRRFGSLLAQWPTMPATVIAERIGWNRSMTVLKDRVRELRPLFTPLFTPPDPASRTDYQPGELVQCDLWFPPVDIPLGFEQVGRPPVLVMVSGYSRVITVTKIGNVLDLVRDVQARGEGRGERNSGRSPEEQQGRLPIGGPAVGRRWASAGVPRHAQGDWR